MVNPKLGAKRVCEACGAKFYDLNKQPATCPKCNHSFDPLAAFVKSEPVREIAPTVEEDDDEEDDVLETEAEEISLDDMDEGISDDDDDDADDETKALAEFDDDEALLDDEDEDEDESFLEDDEDDA